MSEQDWRGMDRATRSAAYNNGAAVPDSAARVADWTARSVAVRERPTAVLDLVYGPKPRNRIDVFPCDASDAPLVAFIHGGYWQRNAKEGFACMALGALARGLDVALVGYTLAPEATLAEIAGEIRAALAVLRRRDAEAGVRRRLIASGWSAGGHLAALAMDWPEVDAALAISGIFDLEPLRGTEIDDKLRLSEAEVADLSPIRRPSDKPLAVAFGADELPELCRQSRDYHAACLNSGLVPVPGADHFSVLDELISPDGLLTDALVALVA